ncbi:MAG: Asp23/Gls24 family envelope stress response protein [Chloroflexi bacterium]|nr:Asp23/Gls24 family envelope stress response protein [Chloroflexota bacterium]
MPFRSRSTPPPRPPADERGAVGLSPNAIAAIASRAALASYGIVGMATRRPIDGIVRMLARSHAGRGVEVRIVEGAIEIALYVIVEYGTKILEVAHNLQQAVKFAVERASGMPVRRIDVYVQDLHVSRASEELTPPANTPRL